MRRTGGGNDQQFTVVAARGGKVDETAPHRSATG
jgi:hypothetical protein